jgi:hypothetical protein
VYRPALSVAPMSELRIRRMISEEGASVAYTAAAASSPFQSLSPT